MHWFIVRRDKVAAANAAVYTPPGKECFRVQRCLYLLVEVSVAWVGEKRWYIHVALALCQAPVYSRWPKRADKCLVTPSYAKTIYTHIFPLILYTFIHPTHETTTQPTSQLLYSFLLLPSTLFSTSMSRQVQPNNRAQETRNRGGSGNHKRKKREKTHPPAPLLCSKTLGKVRLPTIRGGGGWGSPTER